jgi:Spy/CpxP family protein refolding chaperone
MRISSKSTLAILAFALACTPAFAQQGPPNPPPAAPPGVSGDAGPSGPADAPPRVRQMRVLIERGRGGGSAPWGAEPAMGGNRGMMGLGEAFGMGRLNNVDAMLARAQRLLRNPSVRQQLGISDQQETKLEDLLTDFRKTRIQGRANLAVQRIDLENLLAAENPDRAAINRNLQQVGAAQLALEKSAVDFALNVKQELTPEQRQKIRQFLRQRLERRFEGMQGGARFERRGRRRDGSGRQVQPEPPSGGEPGSQNSQPPQ